LQEDPITFDGGINFYQFVSNYPVNFVDPFGLASGRLPGTNIPFRIDTNQAGGPNMHVKWPNNNETIITDKGKWLKTHGGQSLVKPPKKYRRALRKIVKKLKRFASKKYNVAGFLVSGFLEDLDILLEALECGRSFPRQAQRRIQELGNPEIIFSGGIPIPNPYHRPGADII